MPTDVFPVKVPPEVVTIVVSFVAADAPKASVRMNTDASIVYRGPCNVK